jgi:hypothetical protein
MATNPTDHDVRISHLIDDAETTRTHPIRTLKDSVDLLTDALHALRNGSPHVTDEFVERVRDAIDAEIKWLRAR